MKRHVKQECLASSNHSQKKACMGEGAIGCAEANTATVSNDTQNDEQLNESTSKFIKQTQLNKRYNHQSGNKDIN